MSEDALRLVSKDGHAFRMERIHCPTCGPDVPQTEVGLRGGRHHRYQLGIETRIVRCDRCALMFPNPFPFPEDAQELYGDPAKYFAAHDTAAKVEASRRLIRGFVDRLGRPAKSLLDVGSGRGEMLGGARAERIEKVVGLELSTAMVEAAKAAYDVEVLPLLLEDFAEKTEERFDVVVLNAVLEHVYDPNSMIEACRKLMTDDGVLYLDVPNEDHLLAEVGGRLNRILRRPAVYVLAPTFPPYHVFGFSPASLDKLLAKHGFRVEHLEVRSGVKVPSRGGVRDRAMALAGTAINVVANRIGRGHNMFVWARPTR